jgi:hypothetical protein
LSFIAMLGSGSVWNNPAAASQNRDEKENTANRGNQKAGKREPHAPANKGGNVWQEVTTVESSGHAVNGTDYADRETADEKPDTEPSHGSSVRLRRESIDQRHQFLKLPDIIGKPHFHRGRDAERLVDAAEARCQPAGIFKLTHYPMLQGLCRTRA